MMMSSQKGVWQLCPFKGHAYLNQADKQVAEQTGSQESRFQDSRPQDKSVSEQKDIPSRRQAIGTRQEATSEAKDHLITEVK